MPAATRNPVTEAFFRIHPWIYRKTGGRVLGSFGPSPILLLNTRGRRSGQPRTNGLVYLDRGDHWAVAASWAGEPKHPVWYLNLMANPDVTIEVGPRRVEVRARELTGEERDRVWQEIVAQDPSFAVYEERTRGVREIPVVVLEPRDRSGAGAPSQSGVHTVYGLSCSYFTGKLEAYLKARGIPFEFVEMNRGLFRMCARETGIVQLPCIRTPSGQWLTDTTAIIEHFETSEEPAGAPVRPAAEAVAFLSVLFEDLFDEWFWRPALYYRWAFTDDARLMSSRLAQTIMRDVPLPLFLRQQFILHRQRIVYLRKDGVTRQTAPSIEALYLNTLDALEAVFSKRPFLFGERPCEADFGLFGPFFRHFFCDPTPGALMLERAPHVAAWVTRMWTLDPTEVAEAPPLDTTPDGLDHFYRLLEEEYLPYLDANARACAAGEGTVRYSAAGVSWKLPAAPYRVRCFNELKRRMAALSRPAGETVRDTLPAAVCNLLDAPPTILPPSGETRGPLGRLGRPAALFD